MIHLFAGIFNKDCLNADYMRIYLIPCKKIHDAYFIDTKQRKKYHLAVETGS